MITSSPYNRLFGLCASEGCYRVAPYGGRFCALHYPPVTPFTGIGGAPTRATTLPDTPAERKKYPVASGFMDYFPDAIVAISNLSWVGNEQHNPGQPLHWARNKSQDEADTMLRHFLQRGTFDTDGVRHSVKMAWRALALVQKELETVTPSSYEKLPQSSGQPPEVQESHLHPTPPVRRSGVQ